ncbi:MAG: PEP-utilizing enzyme [Acidimicrobiales bacterium]
MGADCEVVGIGVSPGVGRGELHVDVDAALDALDAGRHVVLALDMSSPADVVAMTRAAAIIAVRGNLHSHTAIVANAAGVPAVVGLMDMVIGATGVEIDGVAVPVGTAMMVDGALGVVRWDAP